MKSLLAAFLLLTQPAFATCLTDLSDNATVAVARDETSSFITYLGRLVVDGVIGPERLKNLIDGIGMEKKVVNPISDIKTTADRIHHDNLQDYIVAGNLNPTTVLNWALTARASIERDRAHREKTHEETRDLHYKMKFLRVEKGDFPLRGIDGNLLEKDGRPVRATLTHSLEAMATKVTQKMWADVMGANPSRYKDGLDGQTLRINGRWIQMQPDHPVESITWWSAATFANRISENAGLPPVYDLSVIEFRPDTSAEKGNLVPVDTGAVPVKIHAPDGNIYKAIGYRLPTEAELRFLRSDRGRSTTEYFSGLQAADLPAYAWLKPNSEMTTHPVAELRAFWIDGQAFYDLYGNVEEWANDYLDDINTPFPGIIDPRGAAVSKSRVSVGEPFYADPVDLNADPILGKLRGQRHGMNPGGISEHIGLRLVRTAP